jgi:hypothetical protein
MAFTEFVWRIDVIDDVVASEIQRESERLMTESINWSEVGFRRQTIHVSGMVALSNMLRANHRITWMNLHSNFMDADDMWYLASR